MDETLKELEARAHAAVSLPEMWETLELFNSLDRTSGTEEEFQSIRFLESKLKSYGIDVEVHEYEALLSYPIRASLRVTAPEEREIPCKTRAFGKSTPPQGISGELVYVPSRGGIGVGDDDSRSCEADYEGLDLAGKIVLAERGGPEPVEIAQRKGAIAHIHMWPTGEDAIHEMIVTTVWGTPTPESAGRIPGIPAISVKRSDGEYLKSLYQGGLPVTVRLRAETSTAWRKQLLPVARIRGTEERDKFVLVAGHLDSWYVGITDNATGNAVCLELARVLGGLRDQLKRGVVIAWWPGHSTGRYAGSTWFADNFWEDLHNNCIAYLNIDSPGPQGGRDYTDMTIMAENRDFVADIVGEITGQKVVGERPVRAGDQSFWGAGITSMYMLMGNLPREQQYAVGGSGMNWWWHTEYDTIDTVDPELLLQDTRIYLSTVLRLCNLTVLPYRITPLAGEIHGILSELDRSCGSRFDFGPALARAQEFRRAAAALDERLAAPAGPAEARKLNDCLIGIQRLTIPVNYTYTGQFDHDPAIPIPPIPGLQRARKLLQLDPASDEYRFLLTRLVRERNRVVHALGAAVRLIGQTLA